MAKGAAGMSARVLNSESEMKSEMKPALVTGMDNSSALALAQVWALGKGTVLESSLETMTVSSSEPALV